MSSFFFAMALFSTSNHTVFILLPAASWVVSFSRLKISFEYRINVGNGPVTGWDVARLLPGCYPVVAWATVPHPYPNRTLTVPHPYP